MAIAIELVLLMFAFILVAIGNLFKRLRIFQSVGSLMLMVIGFIALVPSLGISGIPVNSILAITLGTVCVGLGFYFLIENSMDRVTESGRVEDIEEEDYEDE